MDYEGLFERNDDSKGDAELTDVVCIECGHKFEADVTEDVECESCGGSDVELA